MINIVLVEPEIPQNAGNVIRTCAATGAKLYLIKPLGFNITDRDFKRAGLDYFDKTQMKVYDSFEQLHNEFKDSQFVFATKKTDKHYTDVKYEKDCFLVFGKETKGLSSEILTTYSDQLIRIPMRDSIRCLNLSNSVAIVIYEVLRQQGFESLI